MTPPTHTEEREPGDHPPEQQNATLFCKMPDICRLFGFAGTTQLRRRCYVRSDGDHILIKTLFAETDNAKFDPWAVICWTFSRASAGGIPRVCLWYSGMTLRKTGMVAKLSSLASSCKGIVSSKPGSGLSTK